MIIRAVHVRHFRSICGTGLAPCADLNVLIGKNNAGKSNLLSAIGVALEHLRGGKIAAPWNAPRPKSEFNQRDTSKMAKIAIEFTLSPEINQELRSRLAIEAPHLSRSIEQIGSHSSVVFILAGAMTDSHAYLFVEQMAVGRISPKGEDLSVDGIRLLSVAKAVALQLSENVVSSQALLRDLDTIEDLRSGRPRGYPPSNTSWSNRRKGARPT